MAETPADSRGWGCVKDTPLQFHVLYTVSGRGVTQGACEGTARLRDRGLEESRIVALGYEVLHVLELF